MVILIEYSLPGIVDPAALVTVQGGAAVERGQRREIVVKLAANLEWRGHFWPSPSLEKILGTFDDADDDQVADSPAAASTLPLPYR
jgi:hypothetical protein